MRMLGVLAALFYNVGFVLEKRALAGLPGLTPSRPIRLLRTLAGSPGWLAGFALIGGGLVLQGAVLTHLPFSVAQPLYACGLAVTVLLARLVLRERPTAVQLGCLATVAVGVVLLGLSGASPAGSSCDGRALLAVGAAACATSLALYARSRTAVGMGVAAGLVYGVAGLALKGAATGLEGRPAGDWPVLVATSPYAWGWLISSAAGLLLFQSALQRCPAVVLVPVSQLSGTAFTVVAGSLLYREPLPTGTVALTLRLAGCAVVAGAAFALAHAAEPVERTPAP